jgi:hypothetical protein
MPRKKKSSTPRKKKIDPIEAAEAAGAQYADEQVQSDHFRDWVGDQLVEAKEMQRRDPSSVFPIETAADRKKLARNMLQQLEWDTKRQLDTREILELTGGASEDERAVVSAFYKGFGEALRKPTMVDWLAEEVIEPNVGKNGEIYADGFETGSDNRYRRIGSPLRTPRIPFAGRVTGAVRRTFGGRNFSQSPNRQAPVHFLVDWNEIACDKRRKDTSKF